MHFHHFFAHINSDTWDAVGRLIHRFAHLSSDTWDHLKPSSDTWDRLTH